MRSRRVETTKKVTKRSGVGFRSLSRNFESRCDLRMGSSSPPPRYLHTTLKGHTGIVHTATYSKGGARYVLSGGADRTIRLWNASTGNDIKVFKGHGYEVLSISVYVYIIIIP